MPILTEKRLLEIMKEEWDHKILNLDRQLAEFISVKDENDKRGVVGVDTKVRHKGSQLLYTIYEVGPRDITLKTPEGKLFVVSDEEFENEYELG